MMSETDPLAAVASGSVWVDLSSFVLMRDQSGIKSPIRRGGCLRLGLHHQRFHGWPAIVDVECRRHMALGVSVTPDSGPPSGGLLSVDGWKTATADAPVRAAQREGTVSPQTEWDC